MKHQAPQQLDEVLRLFGEVNSNISHEHISKRVLLLMGMTKAGKTTLLYYLLGKRLVLEKNELDVYQMRPQIQYFSATIGNGYDSETVYPNIPVFEAETQQMVIDMPGFDDNRDQYRLLNIYILLQTLRKIDEVHICHVIPEQSLEGSKLLSELEKISHFFNQQLIASESYLSFVLTKVEDENVIESFHDQIEEFRSQELPANIHENLEHIKRKNVNLFFSDDPDPEQGQKMKQKIIQENSFMPINKDPSKLLSENYCKWIIGEQDLSPFINYIHTLIDSLQEILPNLLQLFTLIVHYEFQQIFAVFAQIELQQYQIQLISRLEIQKTRVPLQNIDQETMEVLGWKGMGKDKYVATLTMFQEIDGDQKNFLCKVLSRFSEIVFNIKSGQTCHFKPSFLNKVGSSLKNMSSLISTLQQIKESEVQSLLEKLSKDQKIEVLTNSYFEKWKQNSSKLSTLKGILQLFNDNAYKQLLQRNNITSQPIHIEKLPVHHQIYRKSILDAIEKATINAQKKSSTKIDITHRQKSEKVTSQRVQNLPMSIPSLSFMFQLLDENKSNRNIENQVLLQIFSKVAAIFYRYSFFQQAICFYLSVPDDNSAYDLMIIGVDNGELDECFINEILLPYYTKINPNFQAVQYCYNYLLQTSNNALKLQKEYAASLKDMIRRRDECYLISERIVRFNFEFINPILENKDYYLQKLAHRQKQFERSPMGCQKLLHFVTKKMN